MNNNNKNKSAMKYLLNFKKKMISHFELKCKRDETKTYYHRIAKPIKIPNEKYNAQGIYRDI